MDNSLLNRTFFSWKNPFYIFLFLVVIICGLYPPLSIAVFFITIIPLVIKPQSYFFISLFLAQVYVRFGIGYLVRGVDAGSLDNILKCGSLFFIAVFLVYSTRGGRNNYIPKYAKLVLFSMLFYSVAIIKAATISDSLYFLKVCIPVLLFIITIKYYDKIHWSKMKVWFICFLIAHFLMSVFQINFSSGVASDIVRASGLTPSRNTFSMLMVLMFDFLFVILSLHSNRKISKTDVLLMLAISFLEFISFSRGAWVVFAVTLVVILLWHRRILLLSLISVFLAGFSYFFWDRIQERFLSGFGTEQARSTVVKFLQERISEAPLLGHGFGWAQKLMIDNSLAGGLIQPHNDYLRLLVDMGYVGTFTVLFPFILILFRSFWLMKKSKSRSVKTITLITILSVMQIFSFMWVYNVFDMFYATISFVWFFAAVSEMEYRKEIRKELFEY